VTRKRYDRLRTYSLTINSLYIMGESKRRKSALGEEYGQESDRIFPWLPITKAQAEKFIQITSKGAWIGIGVMIAVWVTVRFIGPAFGFWEVY